MLNLNIFFRLLKRLSFDEFVRFLRTNVIISRCTKFVKLIIKRTNLIRRNIFKKFENKYLNVYCSKRLIKFKLSLFF